MDDDAPPPIDPHRRIERLEGRIEQLAETLERCRKLDLIGKGAVVLGVVVLIALLLGLVYVDTALIAALAAIIGGFVAVGANGSTADQAADDLRAAEAERSGLINAIGLQLVEPPVTGGSDDIPQRTRPQGNGRILP
ncbi:MAG: hypothetical protein IT537_27710 [Hyphomicrobiales bacterium]|nr:hypothetical protein [Hyphomicrobiales bacterium]